ncbi:MAG: GTP cyclohydrolase I FolE2 [Lentisphaerae bacterium]|nr:GTP cyclohydrolase I FolE2 [Lentisphaerota bacterium]MBT4819590.1 GTP cyclohydrolase I FolE2 [Lentisphaerota bacterium]MBT5610788.1 GTP cyclohydrolase I FolE2 [Lentisphaerota bacterium]MBT7053780.1 GTP cyclohydrolase I FolE2 [Lentisphaerota bacterium]MBT7841241.1 GTP cyclohydrolase I FolE2 [Lentisphaerota bacterium]
MHRETESPERARVCLGLGANLGDRESNLAEAMNRLRPQVEVTQVSRTYETDPVGYAQQPRFLNIACQALTSLSPEDLLKHCKRVERQMGRDAGSGIRYGPRPIDVDILLYEDRIVDLPDLQIPHPLIHERAFVLVPLADVAPEWTHPSMGKTVSELAAHVSTQGVRPLAHGLLSGYARDVQEETPHVTVGLDRVGLSDVSRIIRLTSTGRPEYLSASMDLWVDLARDAKGAHMSRFSTAIEDAMNETLQRTAPNIETMTADIARQLVTTQGAMRGEVRVRAEFPLSRRAPVSGLRSQEIYQLIGIAAASRQRTVQLVGVEAEGMTACPCAQELLRSRAEDRLRDEGFSDVQIQQVFEAVPVATHNQTGRGELLISAAPDVRAEDLVHIVEAAMSSETYEILKRPDECFVVSRAHRNPKFVEDVVRDMLGYVVEMYPELPDDTFVRARQTNFETIHKHHVFAERCALLGELRNSVAGRPESAPVASLNTWLDLHLGELTL